MLLLIGMRIRSRGWRLCPGVANLLRPVPEYIECPNCGLEVEIWSDEVEAVCSSCGAVVIREKRLPCLEWCRYADRCREFIEKAREGGIRGVWCD